MDFLNNALNINYQSWKRTINQMLLYKHFKEEAEQKNEDIKAKMAPFNEITNKTPQQIEEYSKLLDQLFENSTNIYKKVQENLENQELLEELYSNKNIDVSEASYKRWLETGEKIKL